MASKAPINTAYRQRKPAAATGRTGTGKPTPAINAKPATTVSRLEKGKAAAAAAPATAAVQAAEADGAWGCGDAGIAGGWGGWVGGRWAGAHAS